MMQRRGFLSAMLAAAAAPAFVRAGSLMRVNPRIIVPAYAQGLASSMLLTQNIITAQMLRIIEKNLIFTANVNRDWETPIGSLGMTVRIAKPPRYAWEVSGG